MQLALKFRDMLPGRLGNVVGEELDQLIAGIVSYFTVEHKSDGTHSDVTADSVVVSGDVTVGDRVTAGSFYGPGIGMEDIPETSIADGSLLARVGDAETITGAWDFSTLPTLAALSGYLKGTAGSVSASATVPETDIADGAVLARVAADETVSGVYDFSNGLKEHGRTPKVGEWTDVAFNAGDFTGSGSMTWTVASGDVGEFAYMVVGKTMFVRFYLNNTTVGGTPAAYLKIAIPGGYSSAAGCYAYMPCFADDNGTLDIGWAIVQTSSSYIEIYLKAFGSWAASTDNTDVRGTAIFEIA